MITKFTAFFSISALIIISQANAADFCVADHSLPSTPSGYACKDPNKVTAQDFFFAGLASPGNTTNLLNATLTPAFSTQFPALNGLGISMSRVDLAPGGVVPLLSTPTAEILVGVEGRICTGFVSSSNVVYTNVVEKGQIVAFPPGLLKWGYNCAEGKEQHSSAYGIYNTPRYGADDQVFDFAVFGSDLAPEVVEKITFLEGDQVKKMKKLFGGSGREVDN